MKRNVVYFVVIFMALILGVLAFIFMDNSMKLNEEKHFCSQQERESDFCIELYQPVCGWSDPEKIKCIKYPCAQTFSNSCFACQNPNVLYWTEGDCPAG